MPRKRINSVWNKWFIVVYIVPTGIWIHGPSPTANWEGSQEQPFHWALMVIVPIEPKETAEWDSESECISMVQKSVWIIFVIRISKKNPLKIHDKQCSHSWPTWNGSCIHVLHTQIAVPYNVQRYCKKMNMEPFVLTFTVWFLSIIILIFSLSCQSVDISWIPLTLEHFRWKWDSTREQTRRELGWFTSWIPLGQSGRRILGSLLQHFVFRMIVKHLLLQII